MRRRRYSAVVTGIALLTALAVAIPQSHASRNAPAKKAADKKKKGSERERGQGGAGRTNRPGQRQNTGAGTANPFGRKPVGSTTGPARTGKRTAAVASTTGRSRKATPARSSTPRKTTAKRPQTRRARVKPLARQRQETQAAAGAYDQGPDQGQGGAFDELPDEGGFDELPDEGYQERGKKGMSSALKKGLKVLGMGVLAVGIGAVFMAGGAPLVALSVPVMMFAIGAGQIIAKPDVDPNQQMVPPGMGGGLNDDGMTPQERYFMARDVAAGGNLPGGLPSRQGLQPPPAMNMGDNNN